MIFENLKMFLFTLLYLVLGVVFRIFLFALLIVLSPVIVFSEKLVIKVAELVRDLK